MGNNYPVDLRKYVGYSIDIVHCIDVNERMLPEIECVKQGIKQFSDDLLGIMEKTMRSVNSIRVRLITFSDIVVDDKESIMLSDFYELPREQPGFLSTLNTISCGIGGGDDYNSGLEALAYAINSKWIDNDGKLRHLIVVWSNGQPRPLGTFFFLPRMPKNIDELSEWWLTRGLGSRGADPRRLLLFAPAKGFWRIIAENWPQVIMYPSEAGKGLEETNYSAILDALIAL